MKINESATTPKATAEQNLPPKMGTLALVLEIAWAILWPWGAFLAPPTKCHTVPPARPGRKLIAQDKLNQLEYSN